MTISKTRLEKINITCVNLNLKKLSRTIGTIYDRKLAEAGLTINQFSILSYISYFDKISLGLLAKELMMDRTTLSKNLKPLFRDGFITLVSENDKRKKNLALTTKGSLLLEKTLSLWSEAQNDIYKSYGKREIHNLLKLLHGLMETEKK